MPLRRGVWSVEEHAESEPKVVRPTPKASRSRSSSWTYTPIDDPQLENTQPREVSATADYPEPVQPDNFKAPAQLSDNPNGWSMLGIALVSTLTSIKSSSMLRISLTYDVWVLCERSFMYFSFMICYYVNYGTFSFFPTWWVRKGKWESEASHF